MKDTAQEQISPRKDIHLGMCTSKEFFRKAGRLGQIDRVGLAFFTQVIDSYSGPDGRTRKGIE